MVLLSDVARMAIMLMTMVMLMMLILRNIMFVLTKMEMELRVLLIITLMIRVFFEMRKVGMCFTIQFKSHPGRFSELPLIRLFRMP